MANLETEGGGELDAKVIVGLTSAFPGIRDIEIKVPSLPIDVKKSIAELVADSPGEGGSIGVEEGNRFRIGKVYGNYIKGIPQ